MVVLSISERQATVLRLYCDRKRTVEIADALGVTPNTLRADFHRLRFLLDVDSLDDYCRAAGDFTLAVRNPEKVPGKPVWRRYPEDAESPPRQPRATKQRGVPDKPLWRRYPTSDE